jgi:hypothetical protein
MSAPDSSMPGDVSAPHPDAPGRRRGVEAGAWRAPLRRWGISVASLIAGLAILVVFRRGVPHVEWIVGYVVVLWLLFAVLTQTRARLVTRGRHRVLFAADYTVQTLYHDLLLFVLPGYLASTTFDGPTVPFFVLVCAAALLTTIDPWYAAVVGPRPGLGRAFFAFSLFAGLNVALPLLGVPPAWAVVGSAGLAVAGLAPAAIVSGTAWWRALLALGGVALVAPALAWVLMPAIPPAPLHLVRPTMARDVLDLEPVELLGARIPVAVLTAGGLVAHTPVSAPTGLSQPIVHRWRHRGRVVATVPLLTPVRGGRAAGFRTYSRKADFPADPRGRWSVDVVTASGQLIGRLRFTVTP